MAAILLALSGSFFALYINSRMKAMNTPTKRPSIAARVTMRDRLGFMGEEGTMASSRAIIDTGRGASVQKEQLYVVEARDTGLQEG